MRRAVHLHDEIRGNLDATDVLGIHEELFIPPDVIDWKLDVMDGKMT